MSNDQFVQDSKEKEVVRESLWMPVFNYLNSKKNYKNIKYLCLPGTHCIFLKKLLDAKKVDVCNCVCIEMSKFSQMSIIQTLAKYANGAKIHPIYADKFELLIDGKNNF